MRRIGTGVGSVALLALLAGGCSRTGGEADGAGADSASDAIVDVRVASVESHRFESVVTAPGQWRSSGELVVSASFDGVLEALTPRVGDRVRAGATLGSIVTRQSWAAVSGAELLRHEARDDAARAEAERAIELARRDVVRVPLVASHGGIVLRRTLEPGDQVAEAAEILALVPNGNFVFEAHVPAASGPRLHAGQHATVSGQDQSASAAVVQRVLPMANDADQSVLAWLEPAGGAAVPSLGRYGSARIVLGAPHLGAAVPDSAVVEDDLTGARQIAVVGADGRMNWTTVQLGTAESGWHEVVSPVLAPGTRVVISGQRGLPAGTRVKWVP